MPYKNPEDRKAYDRQRSKESKRRRTPVDPAKKRAYEKAYREAHPERVKAACKRWADKNRARLREYGREYRLANPDKIRAKMERQRLRDPDVFRSRQLKSLYGITIYDYNKLLQQQGGVCAICGKSETWKINGKAQALSVDHCHKTGRVRGLLCNACNVSIGAMNEDPESMERAAMYLRQHAAISVEDVRIAEPMQLELLDKVGT